MLAWTKVSSYDKFVRNYQILDISFQGGRAHGFSDQLDMG